MLALDKQCAQVPPTVVRIRRKAGVVVQDCDLYIGRAMGRGGWSLPKSIWHNPYTLRKNTIEESLELYRKHLIASPKLLASLPSLSGKRLGCWCAPSPCHGNVLVKLFNERVGTKPFVERPTGFGDLPIEIMVLVASLILDQPETFCALQMTSMNIRIVLGDSNLPQLSLCAMRKAIWWVKNRKSSLFVTGAAGTGKTHFCKMLAKASALPGFRKKVQFTATTWKAALLLDGEARTLHSALGINPTDLTAKSIEKLCSRPGARKRIASIDVIVIDEASMLSAELLTHLDWLLRFCNNRESVPFGGTQLVLVGDLLQLPPADRNAKYFFECDSWKNASTHMVELTAPMRQSTDHPWFFLLCRVREGKQTEGDLIFLKNLVRRGRGEKELLAEFEAGRKLPILCTHNKDISRLNAKAMQNLSPSFTIHSTFPRGVDPEKYRLPLSVDLSTGTLCITTARTPALESNDQGDIVDQEYQLFPPGTILTFERIVGTSMLVERENRHFMVEHVAKRVSEMAHNGVERIHEICYCPLKPAYGVSIHFSQGMTLSSIDVRLGRNVFAPGQAYTALSRVPLSDDVRLAEFDPASIITSKKAIKFYEDMRRGGF